MRRTRPLSHCGHGLVHMYEAASRGRVTRYHGGMTITAAADGSSLGNPGPAGWAWYIDEESWDAGGWPTGTNNLGELTAILELLRATADRGDEELHILADSQYAINVVSKWRLGWKKRGWTKADKKPIKNLEVIQEIDRALEGRIVTFEWVKGHAGHVMNERADDLARAQAEAYQAGRQPDSGPGFSARGRGAVGEEDTTVQESAADLTSATVEVGEEDALAAEKRFIVAWSGADTDTLRALTATDTRRVWPGGSVTTVLEGPTPPHLRVGRIDVHTVAPDVFLTRYTLRWEGGASVETSLWRRAVATEGGEVPLVMVHHQSTRVEE